MIRIRNALPQLRCSPGFSLIVIITVAHAVGTITGIFTLVDGVLLESLAIAGDYLTTLRIALDDMNSLAHLAVQQSQIVDLRFFGGLLIEETAALLDLSAAPIKHPWAGARVRLHREMRRESHP